MERLVQKFGGSSVKDISHIYKVAQIITETAASYQVIAVVSAMGQTTDELIRQAMQFKDEPDLREMDMLLATGEQVSAALLALSLRSLGYKARSLTGWQAGIITENKHGSASIKEVQTKLLEECIKQGEIPIVTGFQGVTAGREITTLGRGGSDITAVALASALKAKSCDIYTDVNGIYTADPRSYEAAKRLKTISYEEMLEFAAAGARVLNARSVELAMAKQVPVRLRSTFEHQDVGTLITDKSLAPQYTICGIACDINHVAFNLKISRRFSRKSSNEGEVVIHYLDGVRRLLYHLNKMEITADTVTLLGKSPDSPPELYFTSEKQLAKKVKAIIEDLSEDLGRPEVHVDHELAKISVIGSGLSQQSGLVAGIFDTLCRAAIPVRKLTTADIRVTAHIPTSYRKEAVKHIHEKFCISTPESCVFT